MKMMKHKIFCSLAGLALLAAAGARAEQSAFEACPDSFEEIWEIEDTHAQSAERLVEVELDGYRLPYDAATGTWYCPVGIDNGGSWPELKLTAAGEGEPRAIWIDRYTDDGCAQAVQNGEVYSFLAVAGERYAYYNVLFTGAELIDIHCDQDIEGEYVPCQVGIRSEHPEDNVDSDALIHLRGGGDLHESEKVSYRIEFHKTEEKKRKVSVLGLPKDTDWILRAAIEDPSVVHDRACWALWNLWDQGEGRTQLQTKSVEVFVNDEYRGLYELLQRVDTKKEIRAWGNPETDVCIRVIHEHNPDEKYPRQNSVSMHGSAYQIRYKPENMTEEEAFSLMDDYEKLYTIGPDQLEDGAFVSLMQARFDLRELLDYYLFHKLCGFRNNLTNNLYIWISRTEDGGLTYHLSPWDMDIAWDLNEEGDACSFPYIDRLLDLHALDSWTILRELLAEKEERVIGTGAVEGIFDTLQNELQKSGAYLRETALWRGGAVSPNVRRIQGSYFDRLDSVRDWLEDLLAE